MMKKTHTDGTDPILPNDDAVHVTESEKLQQARNEEREAAAKEIGELNMRVAALIRDTLQRLWTQSEMMYADSEAAANRIVDHLAAELRKGAG